ncbi:MAG: hypothetical protein KA911_11150 [Xanthomonadales bacterium]|nr:hypothetical protein [Xanthomonadales bacterium]HQW64821.1 poly(R)-hydroxyalkanoic acid synthase subunit PhaE [Pseudomonadota bacterium]MBP6693377.1 hypothetical protein [Xanthomonadales bacterium]MBP7419154.1 hypothetical protein [Xanthomonadales bacterium]HQX25829.1 poly(R)-hydroxyalkanoic acid synthase subunit PhaE [Pseudomonadota bacterium]
MADKRKTSGSGAIDWQEMAGKVTEAWSHAAQQAMSALPGGMGGQFSQWADSLKDLPGGGNLNQTAERVVSGAQQFVSMLQGLVGQMGHAAPGAEGWREAMNAALGGFDASRNPVLDAMRRAVGEGSRSFDSLHAEFVRHASPLRQEMQAALSMPAFGFTREATERRQAMALAVGEYQHQLGDYNALMLEASRVGLSNLESKLAERSEPGRSLKSFREFYDLWIDAAEEGYAEIALSDRFQATYGALVNAQMRLRQLVQDEVERSTGELGMPGRTEIDAAHQKIDALRRRIARLEEQAGLDERTTTTASTAPAANEPAARQAARGPAKARRAPGRARKAPAAKAAAAKAKAPAHKGAKGNAFEAQLAATRGRRAKPATKRGGR